MNWVSLNSTINDHERLGKIRYWGEVRNVSDRLVSHGRLVRKSKKAIMIYKRDDPGH